MAKTSNQKLADQIRHAASIIFKNGKDDLQRDVCIVSDKDADGVLSGIIAYAGLQEMGYEHVRYNMIEESAAHNFSDQFLQNLRLHSGGLLFLSDIGYQREGQLTRVLHLNEKTGIQAVEAEHHADSKDTEPLRNNYIVEINAAKDPTPPPYCAATVANLVIEELQGKNTDALEESNVYPLRMLEAIAILADHQDPKVSSRHPEKLTNADRRNQTVISDAIEMFSRLIDPTKPSPKLENENANRVIERTGLLIQKIMDNNQISENPFKTPESGMEFLGRFITPMFGIVKHLGKGRRTLQDFFTTSNDRYADALLDNWFKLRKEELDLLKEWDPKAVRKQYGNEVYTCIDENCKYPGERIKILNQFQANHPMCFIGPVYSNQKCGMQVVFPDSASREEIEDYKKSIEPYVTKISQENKILTLTCWDLDCAQQCRNQMGDPNYRFGDEHGARKVTLQKEIDSEAQEQTKQASHNEQLRKLGSELKNGYVRIPNPKTEDGRRLFHQVRQKSKKEISTYFCYDGQHQYKCQAAQQKNDSRQLAYIYESDPDYIYIRADAIFEYDHQGKTKKLSLDEVQEKAQNVKEKHNPKYNPTVREQNGDYKLKKTNAFNVGKNGECTYTTTDKNGQSHIYTYTPPQLQTGAVLDADQVLVIPDETNPHSESIYIPKSAKFIDKNDDTLTLTAQDIYLQQQVAEVDRVSITNIPNQSNPNEANNPAASIFTLTEDGVCIFTDPKTREQYTYTPDDTKRDSQVIMSEENGNTTVYLPLDAQFRSQNGESSLDVFDIQDRIASIPAKKVIQENAPSSDADANPAKKVIPKNGPSSDEAEDQDENENQYDDRSNVNDDSTNNGHNAQSDKEENQEMQNAVKNNLSNASKNCDAAIKKLNKDQKADDTGIDENNGTTKEDEDDRPG